MGRGTWQATVHGITRIGHDLVITTTHPKIYVKLQGTLSSKQF